ncbi:MAG: methyltransferase [Pseudomonadota bacterium]|nr:MAG: methyltransferase [Pseudomonadota bacterium]
MASRTRSEPLPHPTEGRRITWDAVARGAVRFAQPEHGYRVNVDSLVLAAFAARGRRAALAVDLGAGVGVVGLLLHHGGACQSLALVERDPALAVLARENLAASNVPGSVYEADLEQGLPRALEQRADLVVGNPPFFDPRGHRPPSDPGRRAARQGALVPFVRAAARALSGDKARAAFVYPARALTELFQAVAGVGLVPKRLRLVHSFADRPARIALVEFRRARPGGLVVEPPLVEWEAPGRRTPELTALTAGATDDRR